MHAVSILKHDLLLSRHDLDPLQQAQSFLLTFLKFFLQPLIQILLSFEVGFHLDGDNTGDVVSIGSGSLQISHEFDLLQQLVPDFLL